MKRFTKKAIAFVISAALLPTPVMADLFDWHGNHDGNIYGYDDYDDYDYDDYDYDFDDYDDQDDQDGQDDYDYDDEDYTEGYPEPFSGITENQPYTNQVKLKLHEQKIISPAFNNAVIGRMTIPDGWNVHVQDLALGSESIICPNAVLVTVSSPGNSCVFKYVSRREFEQRYTAVSGYEMPSEDDFYDYSGFMHYLNYRNADSTCDLMADILFDANFSPNGTLPLTQEEQSQVMEVQEAYTNEISNSFTQMMNAGVNPGQLRGTELTLARKNYSNDANDACVFACSCGYEIYNEGYGAVYDTIMWAMPFVFAMETKSGMLEQYREAFDVFCASTSVSTEYEQMRSKNGERLTAELIRLQNSGNTGDFNSSGSYEDIEDDTISSGETYSAIDGWDDYIRDETDYTTGDGSHVKIPSNFEHVFEGEDGTIYAGNSLDGPYGSTELSPTQIGE